jgi:hypothetical protein
MSNIIVLITKLNTLFIKKFILLVLNMNIIKVIYL